MSRQAPNQLIVAWAVLGFAALLGKALYQLSPLAYDAVRGDLTGVQIGFAVGWTAWMWYTEGYRAFQKQLCPRLVARATWLGRNPRPWLVALAPLYAMGLFHASRKRLIISWVVLIGIVGLVIGVRFLPAPWRGLVDLGVVVGLGWGLGWLLYTWVLAIAGREPGVDPELPVEAAA